MFSSKLVLKPTSGELLDTSRTELDRAVGVTSVCDEM